jgi:hypothetical protein
MDGRLFNKMRAIERLFPKNFSSNYSDQIMAFCFHIPANQKLLFPITTILNCRSDRKEMRNTYVLEHFFFI